MVTGSTAVWSSDSLYLILKWQEISKQEDPGDQLAHKGLIWVGPERVWQCQFNLTKPNWKESSSGAEASENAP